MAKRPTGIYVDRSASTIYRGKAATQKRGPRGNGTQSTVRMTDWYRQGGGSRFGELEKTATGRVKRGSGKS